MSGPGREQPLPLVVVILGPTATGKSDLALALAQRFSGEIVSADSREIYRGLDVGTAKSPPETRAFIPHHLLDLIDPRETYDVARYGEAARAAFRDIAARGRVPLLVGGTGFYIRAATGELSLPMVAADPAVRARLRRLAADLGPHALHQRLAAVDPESARRIHLNDLNRVVRALEVYELTGRPRTAFTTAEAGPDGEFRFLKIGLRLARDVLYARINQRVENMIARGWGEEVGRLLQQGYPPDCPGLNTLGYPEIIACVQGRCGLEEAAASIQQQTRRYAKRQTTWFSRDREVHWLAADAPEVLERAAALVRKAITGAQP